jgi:hypothetical protein
MTGHLVGLDTKHLVGRGVRGGFVWHFVGSGVDCGVGQCVGAAMNDGVPVGHTVGCGVGQSVGAAMNDGRSVGHTVGCGVGQSVGAAMNDGRSVGHTVGGGHFRTFLSSNVCFLRREDLETTFLAEKTRIAKATLMIGSMFGNFVVSGLELVLLKRQIYDSS